MITTAFFILIISIIKIFTFLPAVNFPSWIHNAVITYGGYARPWDMILPISQITLAILLLFTILTPLLILRTGMFIYGLIRGHQARI